MSSLREEWPTSKLEFFRSCKMAIMAQQYHISGSTQGQMFANEDNSDTDHEDNNNKSDQVERNIEAYMLTEVAPST